MSNYNEDEHLRRLKVTIQGGEDHGSMSQESSNMPLPRGAIANKQGGSSTRSDAKKPSIIWSYFNKVPIKDAPRRFKLICRLCKANNIKQEYQWATGDGTSTQARHLLGVHGIGSPTTGGGESSSGGQTQIADYMTQTSGGGIPFFYNIDRMIDNMATYISLDELSFSHGESFNYEEFNRLSLQPAYSRVPRNTLKRRTMSQYYKARGDLIEYLRTFSGNVCLTSDTWTSKQGEHYLCITAHWIDSDYNLQKRIIAFDVMEESHSGYDIFTRISGTCEEFNLIDKLFTISLDNATANANCIGHIQNNMSTLLSGETFLHVRCCAYIINLSAQEGISFIAPLLLPIRKVIKWLRRTSSMKRRYKLLCKQNNMRPTEFYLDTPARWNSTYIMLRSALRYRHIITTLYNEYHPSDSNALINDATWEILEPIYDLLKTYYDATQVLSLVYEPNVHLVIMECIKIVKVMSICESHGCLKHVINSMRVKWLSHFSEFPVIYGVATILDPDLKSEGLKNMLEFYYATLEQEYDVDSYVNTCISILTKLYEVYNKNSGTNVEGNSSHSSSMIKASRFGELHSIILKTPKTSSNNSTSSVNEYLSSMQATNGHDFNILIWWRNHSHRYPILTKVAKDILIVPASTIVSESAFSAGRKVLDEKRSSLAPEFVKICVCKKDWDQAQKRTQGMKKDDGDGEDDPFMIMDTSSGSGASTDIQDDDNLDG